MATETAGRSLGRAALVAAALGAGLGGGCGPDFTVPAACDSPRIYFAEAVWPIVQSRCLSCHSAQGKGKGTSYVLHSPVDAGFLDANLATIATVAGKVQDGKSLWLAKPTGEAGHEGGQVVTPGSPEHKAMLGLLVRLKNDAVCETDYAAPLAAAELADPSATLRRAAIILAGRLPTAAESRVVAEAGLPGLEVALDELMAEEGFVEHVVWSYAEPFETDAFLLNAAYLLPLEIYPSARWFQTASRATVEQYGLRNAYELETLAHYGIAREPLALVARVVREDRPLTEVLTADYFMVTPLSARSYGVTDVTFDDENDGLEFAPAKLEGVPHAGVLTSPMILNRYQTSVTNLNRRRAQMVYRWFLGTDLLRHDEQALELGALAGNNPARDQPACATCHAELDPVAGCFQGWDERGVLVPDVEWPAEMPTAGFAGEELPAADTGEGLQWLGQRIAANERFALASVYTAYRGLTGLDPLVAPTDVSSPTYGVRFAAFFAQDTLFRAVAQQFAASGYNLKVIVKELVLSPYFRAHASGPLGPEQELLLARLGVGQLLTPEELHRKIAAVLGIPWYVWGEMRLTNRPRDPARQGRLQIAYGGMDGATMKSRVRQSTGLMAAVAERMANEMACYAVARDFQRGAGERLLFPPVEVDGAEYDVLELEPESQAGMEIPSAVAGIKAAMVQLHTRLLGETLAPDDPEIERSYTLFAETWHEGKLKVASQTLSTYLEGSCRASTDFWTGQALPEEERIEQDEKYIIRAWMAVLTYLLSDYRFLYE
ncbi:MAG: hypothetical protein HY744_20865 [Deltaproteobacteria bacterium]|nr:hypothetical protein [Deltaproteobacteria bacterium]